MLYQFFIDANEQNKEASAKGLLMLFVIGFLPILVGVQVDSLNFNVPWLANVQFNSPQNFLIAYCCMVVFSVYRYYLNNRRTSIRFAARAFTSLMQSDFLRKRMLRSQLKSIADSHDGYEKIVMDIEPVKVGSCYRTVEFYNKSDAKSNYGVGVMYIFFPNGSIDSIAFHYRFPVELHNLIGDDLPSIFSDAISEKENNVEIVRKGKISPVKMSFWLVVGTLTTSFKVWAKDIELFDFYFPIISNICLVYYMLFTTFA